MSKFKEIGEHLNRLGRGPYKNGVFDTEAKWRPALAALTDAIDKAIFREPDCWGCEDDGPCEECVTKSRIRGTTQTARKNARELLDQ